MAAVNFPLLKVAKILDPTTLVLAGQNVDQLSEGDKLIIVSVGARMDEIGGAPLVIEKASVTVTLNAGEYVIARPAVVVEEIPAGPSVAEILSMTRRPTVVSKRPALPVAEADLAGNPATRPIAPGDFVVRRQELKDLVRLLKDRREV